jgi:fatty-acyl-CoA synthase
VEPTERAAFVTRSHLPAVSFADIRDTTVGDVLRDAASAAPDATGLVFARAGDASRRRWTHREVLDAAIRNSVLLLDRFEPGERVALWASNRPEWLFAQFGAALAGIVLVTVNPSFRRIEVGHVLRAGRVSGVIVERESRGNPLRALVDEVRHEVPELRAVIDLDEWAASADAVDRSRIDSLALPAVHADDPLQIQFTSGTTGAPKGAVLTHRGMTNVPRVATERFGLKPSPVWINAMPLFHVGGCGLSTMGPLTTLGTQVLVDRFEPGLVLDLVESERATFLGGVPTMLLALMEHPDFARRDLTSLEVVLSGGSAVAPELVSRIEAALGVHFIVAFGQTEAHGHVTQTLPSDTAIDKAETIGTPLPFIELRVAPLVTADDSPHEAGAGEARDRDDAVALGEVGEVCVRSPLLMAGYFGDPAATAKAIDDDGWLHTGDLATMDDRGYLRFTGRLKEMIVRGGENLHPREIEDVLFMHPDVAEAVVIGVPDERWGEQVAAFVRRRAASDVSAAELRAHVRSLLAHNKTPAQWFFVDEFPTTASGKVQKFALLERWTAGAFDEQRESGE